MEESAVGDGAPPPSRRAGSSFGHYQLGKLLGRGGFGEVYKARDSMMGREVALKLIASPYSQDPAFRARLYREARTAGRLHEPHVVPIHNCGEIDGQLYIDMRLIKGTDLQTVLARNGPLPAARAVAIVHQIACALDAAHAVEVVHRDVKPANILLTDDDFAYLVDFGLANAATDAKLTGTGATIGTLAYMAPERLRDAKVSSRADTYALACVLYECLTGSPPYATVDLPALITAHLTAPIPRPSQQRSDIPAGFDDVIARGMAKRPEDRYTSTIELAGAAYDALSPLDRDRADSARADTVAASLLDRSQAPTQLALPANTPAGPGPTRVRRRRRAIVALSILGAVALIALAAFMIAGTEHAPSQPSQASLPFAGLDHPDGVAVDAAGNVYVTDWGNDRVLKIPAGSDRQVELPFAGLKSPDDVAVDLAGSVYVADTGNNRVLKLPAGTETPIELPFAGLNTPKGVAVDSVGNVYVADTDSHRVLKLAAGTDNQVELPFAGVSYPWGVAVDNADNVYVTDNNRVMKLPAGTDAPTTLRFTALLRPDDVAVDSTGNVYVSDDVNNRVLKQPAGSNMQEEVAFTDLDGPDGVAVDSAGTVYVADTGNNRVLSLPAT
ncbi:MAG: serine/threonine-protein kinase PknD [Mycolicibacterium sp.]|uniref:serine/threonine-protein kinase PknD n=1 Tax=Mycolicibacterium sp. TaxID=2320850 RepID=UPI003D119002